MGSKTFFIACVAALASCMAAYFFAVDRVAIPERIAERSYKQFLLKASEPIEGKIVISSGSNSTFSIDALRMERYFGRLTINLGDDASFPFEHRIYNLGNHLSKGDLVIFPLEWDYYDRGEKLARNYLKKVVHKVGISSFYYRELPFLKKVDFVFTDVPLTLALKMTFGLNSSIRFNDALRVDQAQAVEYTFWSIANDRRGTDFTYKQMPADSIARTMTCDEFILGGPMTVSGRFKKNLKLLQAMVRKTGAKVIFTWPAVVGKVGNECYTSDKVRSNLDRFMGEITGEIESHGFRIVGDIYDNRYDSSCYRDTYYHLREHCTIDRTIKLIALLKEGGFLTKTPGYDPAATNERLIEGARGVEAAFINSFGPAPVGAPIAGVDLTKHLFFREGWGVQRDEGIWSVGNTSVIIIPRPADPVKSIRFKGRYFYGDERTRVWIDDQLAGDFVLTDKAVALNGPPSGGRHITITLEHANPVSRAELGLSNDPRRIKYHLESIELLNE